MTHLLFNQAHTGTHRESGEPQYADPRNLYNQTYEKMNPVIEVMEIPRMGHSMLNGHDAPFVAPIITGD